ncbi:MAG: hypothetical protein ACI94Y_004134 [Maribacter sp.]|jgi:hypothetical protein
MKNVFQIIGIVVILLALLIPQSSYGQVSINMNEDIIFIKSDAKLRYVAYYTKEGFREIKDYSEYSEQPSSAGIPVADLKGKHDYITVFAINENGDVDSGIFSLTNGAMPEKSTITVVMREDGALETDTPDFTIFEALYTKEGYWGIDEYTIDDEEIGTTIGGLDSGKYPFVTVAGIDAKGNVYAKKIMLK